ncbi:MAG: MASE3 domain-containing sensor histidine kinase [Eubacteriales bacterium]
MSLLRKKMTFKYLFILISLMVLFYVGTVHYLLFHSLVEMLCITVAFMILSTVRNLSHFNQQKEAWIILAIAYGVVGCFDLIHTLSYKGMGVFLNDTADLPTQLWIAARYIESISLLSFILLYNKKLRTIKIVIVYITIIIAVVGSIYFNFFPDCYIDGIGLTLFKKISELIIVCVLLFSLKELYRQKKGFHTKTWFYLYGSIICTILSEMCFVFYMDIYGLCNISGHIFKLISYYLLYKGVIQVGILHPYIQLECNERKYYNLIRILPEGIIIQGDTGIQLMNEAGSKILGISEEHAYGKTVEELLKFSSGDLMEKLCNIFNKEYRFTRWDGEVLDLEVSVFPFIYNEEKCLLILLKDISERRKTEKLQSELAAEEKKLKEALEYDRLRNNFFNNISHEFKTPLNVILGISQLLDVELKNHREDNCISSNYHTYIKTIKHNSYRLWRLLDNLIDITKINTGSFKMSLQNYNIVSVVEDMTLSVARYLKDSHVEIIFDTDIEEKNMVCDSELIERMILNLISNGIKFSKGKGMIYIRLINGKEYITLEVHDKGIGIPEDKIHTIFQSFSKIDESLSRNNEGSGIGLALVSALVEIHQGKITVVSKKGIGSIFTIKLPTQLTIDSDNKRVLGHYIRRERIPMEFSDIYSLSNSTHTNVG